MSVLLHLIVLSLFKGESQDSISWTSVSKAYEHAQGLVDIVKVQD